MATGERQLVALLLAAGLFAGCGDRQRVQVGARPPAPVSEADRVELWLTPGSGVNWDESPGPDGLQAQVRFYRMDQPLSVLVDGVIEFHLFDERVSDPNMRALKPAQTWRFTQEELGECMARSIVGWGYAMRLPWAKLPTSRIITLAAVYTPPDGRALWSAPIHVPMGER
jgi:hypothetical protein